MFGLGLLEIGVVVLLAIMLFPPTELPKLARSVARTYGQVRRIAEDFRRTVMLDDELRGPIDEVRNAYRDARWQLQRAEQAAQAELRKAEREARGAVMKAREEVVGAVASRGPTEASEDETTYEGESESGSEHSSEGIELVAPPPSAPPTPPEPDRPKEGAA